MNLLTITKDTTKAIVSSNRSTGIIIILVAAALKVCNVDVLPENIMALATKIVAGAGACVGIFGIIKDVLRKTTVKANIIEPKI